MSQMKERQFDEGNEAAVVVVVVVVKQCNRNLFTDLPVSLNSGILNVFCCYRTVRDL